MKSISFISIFFCSLFLIQCTKIKEQVQQDLRPSARGEMDEIIIIMDSVQWNGPLGEEIKKIYQGFIVGLPQDEVKFKFNQVSPFKVNNALRATSNLIFVMTLDSKTSQSKAIREYFTDNSLKMISRDSSIFMTVRKDEFARGQTVLYLFSQSEELLRSHIKSNRQQLSEVFDAVVRERTRAKILGKTDPTLQKAIQDRHGYQISVPYGWDLAKDLPNFIWLRHLEAESEMNIFIHEGPYTDQSVFNDIGAYRDKITEQFLRDSQKQDLYITRQEIINVFTERVNFDGKFAVEARGLWKISDNSGGGPFLSYSFVDEAGTKLYYIEGYVYSPGTKKKEIHS